MTQSLSARQTLVLGLVVLLCLAVGTWGLFRIGGKNGLWAGEPYELTVVVADAQGMAEGTPVYIRGVEAGQVAAVDYADEGVLLKVHLRPSFREHLHADAQAAITSRGMLGNNVLSIKPGTAKAGPLPEPLLHAETPPDLTEVAAKLNKVASRLDTVLKDIHEGDGTLPKLLKDDGLYRDLKDTTTETKKLVKNLDESVGVMRTDAQKTLRKVDTSLDAVQGEVAGLKDLVRTGKEAATAIKQDAEAIKSLPIVRSYVDDPTAHLVKPTMTKDRVVYLPDDLFEPGTAILTTSGKHKLNECAGWLRSNTPKGSEVVVASLADPKDDSLTGASAAGLTKKQAETITEYFRDQGVHKIGYVTRRKVTPVGLGFDPSPVVEKDKLPAARVEIILFVPGS